MISPQDLLEQIGPSPEEREWIEPYTSWEEVYDECPNPRLMLWFCSRLNIPLDLDRLRLWSCWCIRYTLCSKGGVVWDLLLDKRSRRAVEMAEKFARKEINVSYLEGAHEAAKDVINYDIRPGVQIAAQAAARAAAVTINVHDVWAIAWYAAIAAADQTPESATLSSIWCNSQANALRNFVVNPFRGEK